MATVSREAERCERLQCKRVLSPSMTYEMILPAHMKTHSIRVGQLTNTTCTIGPPHRILPQPNVYRTIENFQLSKLDLVTCTSYRYTTRIQGRWSLELQSSKSHEVRIHMPIHINSS
jgi:hypothetical protein